MTLRGWLVAGVAGLAACATPAHVRRVELQVGLLRAEQARQDSARAVQLAELARLQQRLADSLEAVRGQLGALGGTLSNDLYAVQQQLVQVQALTGQSQQRLSELRAQLETRAEQLSVVQQQAAPATAAADTAGQGGAPAPGPVSASAEQMFQASLQQLRRGSMATARGGFRELLRAHGTSARAPDAMFYLGQSYTTEAPDSARAYYEAVVRQHATSPRAPAALYNLGLLAERRDDAAGARDAFQRLVRDYPRSDEAALARDRLKGPAR